MGAFGARKSSGDQAAIKFAAAFYATQGYAKSVQDSFDLGLISLKLDGTPKIPTSDEPHRKLVLPEGGKAHRHADDQVPQLITRKDVDALKVFLVKPKLPFEEITRHTRKRIAERAFKWLDHHPSVPDNGT